MIKLFIYKATNKRNGKSYIGQTINSLNIRKTQHLAESKRAKYNYYFYNAIRKWGIDIFDWEILEECVSKEELDKKEIEYIKIYNSLTPKGYNLSQGGKSGSGWKRPDVSKRMRENNPMKNPELATRVGKKISLWKIGKSYEELYGAEKTFLMKRESSERMRKNNPMKNTETVKKVLETKRRFSYGLVC